jgi:DNA primase
VIPAEFLQTLLARVDIVPIIDRAVPLKKAGANYAACCPFHKEKSPSFTVSPSKQFYHCFGCGAHGTAISFLMEYQGKSFPDAVEELASGVGMEVPRDERSREAAHAAGGLFEVLLTAAQHYKTQLKLSDQAKDYFKSRGVSGEIARTFHLGFAPDKWQGLAEAFAEYEDAALDQAGLVIAGDNNKRYDRFRGRVMFPIMNQQGRVIAFGGRVLGEGEPKYLNSPETPVFSKGRELYGLYQAQKAIRDDERVLVVEGYMDVIALHQYGIGYAVATLGTATTEQHIERLFRLADEVVFSFDGDKAGMRAAWRALENAFPALQDGKAVKFLFLPSEHDPDSYIREHGTEGFAQRVREAEPLSKYWLRTLQERHPDDSPEARAALLSEAKTFLEKVPAPLMRDVLMREVANAARVDAGEFGRGLAPLAAPPSHKKVDADETSATPFRPVERQEYQQTPWQPNQAPAQPYTPSEMPRVGQNQKPNRWQKGSKNYANERPAPRAVPLSVYERLLRLGLDRPELFLSLEDEDIVSSHPDALLLQSVVRIVKTAPQVLKSAAELIALAADPNLQETLESKLQAAMTGATLNGKALEDEWRALVERARLEAKSPAGARLYMNPNNRAPS